MAEVTSSNLVRPTIFEKLGITLLTQRGDLRMFPAPLIKEMGKSV